MMRILDVKLGLSATGSIVRGPTVQPLPNGRSRFHIRTGDGRSLCRLFLFGSEDAKFLIDTNPEPLSVKLPDGRTYWGAQTEIKVHGVKVCVTCLRRLRKQNR